MNCLFRDLLASLISNKLLVTDGLRPLKLGEFYNHFLKTPGPSWKTPFRNMSILKSESIFIFDFEKQNSLKTNLQDFHCTKEYF